jgi:hypothetical protein
MKRVMFVYMIDAVAADVWCMAYGPRKITPPPLNEVRFFTLGTFTAEIVLAGGLCRWRNFSVAAKTLWGAFVSHLGAG